MKTMYILTLISIYRLFFESKFSVTSTASSFACLGRFYGRISNKKIFCYVKLHGHFDSIICFSIVASKLPISQVYVWLLQSNFSEVSALVLVVRLYIFKGFEVIVFLVSATWNHQEVNTFAYVPQDASEM